MTRSFAVAASLIALILLAPAASPAQVTVEVQGSWTGTFSWDITDDDGTGVVDRWTGEADFKGTGELVRNFDDWELAVDWTETRTNTYDGSLGGERCSQTGTGSGTEDRGGFIEFARTSLPQLSQLNVELDSNQYTLYGDCHPIGSSTATARGGRMFFMPEIFLPDGRATTTLSGTWEEAEGGYSGRYAWQLTRKPDADCDGVPDEGDGEAGRPCNFTKTRIEPVERTRRKLRIEGYIDPHYGPEQEMTVVLLRKRAGSFRKIATKHPVVDGTLEWKTAFSRPDAGRCRVKARFPGSRVGEPSKAVKTFDC